MIDDWLKATVERLQVDGGHGPVETLGPVSRSLGLTSAAKGSAVA